jgi:hypothetical protein
MRRNREFMLTSYLTPSPIPHSRQIEMSRSLKDRIFCTRYLVLGWRCLPGYFVPRAGAAAVKTGCVSTSTSESSRSILREMLITRGGMFGTHLGIRNTRRKRDHSFEISLGSATRHPICAPVYLRDRSVICAITLVGGEMAGTNAGVCSQEVPRYFEWWHTASHLTAWFRRFMS